MNLQKRLQMLMDLSLKEPEDISIYLKSSKELW